MAIIFKEQDKETDRYKIAEMKVSPFSRSPVDIIIPFHGQYDKVTRLIKSIILATKSNPYQITIVDDGSPNNEYLSNFEDFDIKRPAGTKSIVQCIRSEEQLGFAGALQLGYANTQQPWVIFLHSDCVVENPHWMIEMGKTLLDLKSKNVRMVSARNNLKYPGVPTAICGKKSEIVNDYILTDEFLPLFCVMAHRDLYKKIGFLKQYPYGTYEDEEFAFRMNHYGYKQAICGKSWVFHEGGSTINALLKDKPELREILDMNRDRCIHDMQNLI